MTQVERKVIAAVLGNGLQYVDAELDRLQGDRRFRDVALVVRCEHLAILARADVPWGARKVTNV